MGVVTCTTVSAASLALPCNASAANGYLSWAAFQDSLAAFPAPGANPGTPVNTVADGPLLRGPKASFSVSFATPVAWSSSGAGDPVLTVTTTGQTVRLGDRGGDGYPFALMLPSDWKLPVERQDMGLAHPIILWINT